jgi:hypothetical protein
LAYFCWWDAKKWDDLLYTICQYMSSHLCHGVWLTTYTCMVCSALSIHVVSCESCCLGCYIYMFGLQCTVNPCWLMCVMLFGLLHIHFWFAFHGQSMLSHVCHAVGLRYSATIRTDGLLIVSGGRRMNYTDRHNIIICAMLFGMLNIYFCFPYSL